MSLTFKQIFYLFVFLLFPIVIFSQTDIDRSDYALLWEIKGNNLEHPSYLFGSMHIRADFAFEFPDSLFFYLEQCDAFANEVHLDSATYRMLDIYYGDGTLEVDSNYIAFIKTKKVQLDSTYTPKTKKLIDLLANTPDSTMLESVVSMPTMLDAYLMNIARGMGKKLYGLENIDNHLYDSGGKGDFKFSIFSNSYNQLQKYYYAGDLSSIQKIIQKEAHSFDNLELIPRNYIMVESMQRIMEQQSLFSVVGAAHLPGKEGVIQLLRDKGYSLRRVEAVFNNKSTLDIKRLTKKRPWPVLEHDRSPFILATPLPFVLKNSTPFESTYLQIDIGRGLFYTFITSSLRPEDFDNFDEDFFANDGYKILSKSPFVHHGLKGYEYKLSKTGEDVSSFFGYVFIENGELYYLQIGAYDENTFEHTADHRFFLNRFSIKDTHPDKWSVIEEMKGGFKANFPRHFTYRNGQRESYWTTYNTHTYTAGFGNKKTSVTIQYTDIPINIQEKSDSLQLVSEIEDIEKYLNIKLVVTAKTNNKWGKNWTFSGKIPDYNLFLKGHLQTRANRIYAWYSIDKKGFQQTKKLMQGFQLIPFNVKDHNPPAFIGDSLFQCFLPQEIEQSQPDFYTVDFHNSAFVKTGYATSSDPNTGANYAIEIKSLHPLFGTTDTLGFLRKKAAELIEMEENTTISSISLLQCKYPQLRIHSKDDNTRFEAMHQLYLKDNYLILKTVQADSSYFTTPVCTAFFDNDIWIEKEASSPPPLSALINKGDTIIELLRTQDSTYWPVLNKAIDTRFSFEVQHFEPLLKVLFENHWTNTKPSRLLQRKLLVSLFSLKNTNLEAIKNLFESLPSKHFLKEEILTALLENTSENKQDYYDLFFKLLREDTYLCKNAPLLTFSHFYEHPSVLEQNIDNIKLCLDTQKDHIVLWDLAVLLHNNNETGKRAIASILDAFIRRGKERLRAYTPIFSINNSYSITENKAPFYILDFYRLFPENELIKEQVRFYLSQKNTDLFTIELADFALEHQIEVPKKKRKQLLDGSTTWLPAIRLLNKYHLLDEIKEKYYQKEDIAKALLAAKLKSENILASDFILEDTFEVVYENETKIFYTFTYNTDGRPSRIGAAGLFSTNKTERHFIDNNIVYTDYPVVKRRRLNKIKELVEENLGL